MCKSSFKFKSVSAKNLCKMQNCKIYYLLLKVFLVSLFNQAYFLVIEYKK